MRRLYNQVLNTVINSAVQCLVHIIDHFTITGLYMVNNNLCGKCSSYRPVRISGLQGIFDSLNICYTAVVKGSTKAYYQNFIFTDFILITCIILGSISGISSEVIRICVFTFYQFLLCIC